MAEGYLVDKALGLYTEYMRDFGHTRRRIWDEEEERRMTGVVCEGKGLKQRLSQQEVASIHLHVVTNSASIAPLYMYVYICNAIHFGSECIFSLNSGMAVGT